MTVPVRYHGVTHSELVRGATFSSDRPLHRGELLLISEYFADLAEIAMPRPMLKTDLWPQEHFDDLTARTLGITTSQSDGDVK